MRTALLSLTFLLAGSMAAPAFAHTAAPKKKVTATTKKGKILPMKEYIDQLMAKMTLQEKIGQLNLMVAGDITTGGALDTQVGNDIALPDPAWQGGGSLAGGGMHQTQPPDARRAQDRSQQAW